MSDSFGFLGWGYEGQSVEDLIAYCRRLNVHTVVDVRMNAISRKKGFSKTALSTALQAAGFNYVHLRALGNPKDNRPGFAHPGSAEAETAHKRFVNEVLTSSKALEQLDACMTLVEQGNVLFLCFEQSPDCCHRHLIIEALSGLRNARKVRVERPVLSGSTFRG